MSKIFSIEPAKRAKALPPYLFATIDKMKKRQKKKKKKITGRNPCVADGSLFNMKGGLLDRDKKSVKKKKRRQEDNKEISDGRNNV